MEAKELKDIEMNEISGGVSYSFINAITKALGLLYNLGKEAGSAVRRLATGNYCPTH